MSSVDNLKLVRKSVADEPRDKNIMFSRMICGTPSCLLGHCGKFVDTTQLCTEYLGFIANEYNYNNLFMPNFSFADYQAKEGEAGYITKSHVLRFLDLLIAGEKNLEKAWRESKDER